MQAVTSQLENYPPTSQRAAAGSDAPVNSSDSEIEIIDPTIDKEISDPGKRAVNAQQKNMNPSMNPRLKLSSRSTSNCADKSRKYFPQKATPPTLPLSFRQNKSPILSSSSSLQAAKLPPPLLSPPSNGMILYLFMRVSILINVNVK